MNAQLVKNVHGHGAFSTAKENTHILRTTKGRLLRLKAANLSTTDLFLQIHDLATALTGGETPTFVTFLGGHGFASLEDIDCANGIQVALSTTDSTYTAPGAASGWFHAEHE